MCVPKQSAMHCPLVWGQCIQIVTMGQKVGRVQIRITFCVPRRTHPLGEGPITPSKKNKQVYTESSGILLLPPLLYDRICPQATATRTRKPPLGCGHRGQNRVGMPTSVELAIPVILCWPSAGLHAAWTAGAALTSDLLAASSYLQRLAAG